MRRVGSGTVPPDENFDLLIRTSLQEDFAGYAPDPTSALGELRHRTHGTERKPRRLLPFLPGLPKTVIAVVCVVLVTLALLIVPRVFHIRAANTKPVTPAPVVQHSDISFVTTPSELGGAYGHRFGPAFELQGPNGEHVTGVLTVPSGAALWPRSTPCNSSVGPLTLGWGVWITLTGDLSFIDDPTTFRVTSKDATEPFTIPDRNAYSRQMIGFQTLTVHGLFRSKETRVPVDIALHFTGSNGLQNSAHLTATQGFSFVVDTRNVGICRNSAADRAGSK
jgi:hypothetical protein